MNSSGYDNHMKGDFSRLPIPDDHKAMLCDVYNAVTIADKWDWLKTAHIVGNEPEIVSIASKMKCDPHSEFSFAMLMRSVECIAKKGWDTFINGIQSSTT
jgi:hypothetical protein